MRIMLPSTSAPLYFLASAERRDILFNQFVYPALQVQSIRNRANETAVIQNTSSAQPTYLGNALQGTYSWQNNGGGNSNPPGRAGLVFATSQYLEYDGIAASFSGAETPITIVAAVSGITTGTILGFGSAGTTPTLSLSMSGGTLSWKQVSSAGTFTASATMGTGVHVVSATKANGAVTLRIDSAQVATTSVTAATETFTTFCLGALNNNGTVGSFLTGNIGVAAVYGGNGAGGPADVYQVETYLLSQYGVIRGASSGINSGF